MAITDSINKLKPNLNTPSIESVKNLASTAKNNISEAVDSIDIDSINSKEIIKLLLPFIQRTLLSIANSEQIINLAIKESTTLLNRKGKVEIEETTITFYPITDGPWLEIKAQFDRKIQLITKNIEEINKILTILNKTLTIVNTILTALQIFFKLKESILTAKLISASADLATPSPVKPLAAETIATLNIKINNNNKIKDRIDDIKDILSVINGLIVVINSFLTELKIKISGAKLIIVDDNADYKNTKDDLLKSFNSTEVPLTLEETIISSNNIKYTIKIVNLKDGFNKAVAYDSLSGLLITQTAPSIIKSPYELIQELKQILS